MYKFGTKKNAERLTSCQAPHFLCTLICKIYCCDVAILGVFEIKKKRFKFISLLLSIVLFLFSFVEFLPTKKKEILSFNTAFCKASEAVVVEVASEWLLTLLASLGVTAEGIALSDISYDKYVKEQYDKYLAENTNGVSFVVNNIAYNITNPGASTLSNDFARRVQEAISNSPEAAAEFEKLIEAVQNGAEITGGMLQNLWMMLAKGAVDDYNNVVEDEFNSFQNSFCEEWEVFKYYNWTSDMKKAFNSGYSDYVLFRYLDVYCIAFYPDNSLSGHLYFGESGNSFFGYYPIDSYIFDCFLFRCKFLDDGINPWNSSSFQNKYENVYNLHNYGIYGSVPGTTLLYLGYYFNDFIGQRSDVLDFVFGIPDIVDDTTDVPLPGDTTEDKPYILNPSDVITEMPEKIVNDEPITIPDDAVLDDVVSNPSLPNDDTEEMALPWGIVGVPVTIPGSIDLPWEVNPSVPEKPDLPSVDTPAIDNLPGWLQVILDFLQKIIDAITSIISGIVDGILKGLKELFVPSSDFLKNHFNALQDKLANKFGFSKYELFFDALKNVAKGSWNFKFKFGFLGHEYNLQLADVDEWFVDSNLNKIHYLIRGFFLPLIILANIQFLTWFLRGTYFISSGSSVKNEKE